MREREREFCNIFSTSNVGCFSALQLWDVSSGRIYEGVIRKGDFIINVNTGKKIKVRSDLVVCVAA